MGGVRKLLGLIGSNRERKEHCACSTAADGLDEPSRRSAGSRCTCAVQVTRSAQHEGYAPAWDKWRNGARELASQPAGHGSPQ